MNTKGKKIIAYCVWFCLYALCVGLGTVETVEGVGKALFVMTGIIFFLPGAYLLWLGKKEKDGHTALQVRIIAICSLALTVAAFCANVMAVSASAQLGSVLNEILNLVSAPMFCCQYWIVSIFLWACLLSASFTKKEKK